MPNLLLLTAASFLGFATTSSSILGAALRLPSRFREYAVHQKKQETRELIALLSRCDLLRHLPPEEIESILSSVRTRKLGAGEILFKAGDPGDALYIVSRGSVDVLPAAWGSTSDAQPIAQLGPGNAFGEMALLTGSARTATIRAAEAVELLEIGKEDFERLIASDRQLALAVQRLSHQRAISNLSSGGTDPGTWAKIASSNVLHLSRDESDKLLVETGHGAGMAIVLGNILDTIPACLVIGAKFTGLAGLSLTLMAGMFLSGIPEAAASGAMLKKAGYRPATIFGLWSLVLIAAAVGTLAGKLFIGNSQTMMTAFLQALAGGAVLACVAHAMIPEAIHEGGSVVVLPTVAGFLFALYLVLYQNFS